MSRVFQICCIAVLMAAIGCKESGSVSVHSITFQGVKNIDVTRLKAALATRENTKVPIAGWELPWGRKNYFDRGRFDADLKRIEAFYADRGFPDARVTDVDVKLNSGGGAVDVKLTVDEGEPVKVAVVEFQGFDPLPAEHLDQVRREMPLRIGLPRDRLQVTATHEMAVNELRDHGYPYARVRTDESTGANPKEAVIVFTAEPGPISYFGDVQISGNTSVSDRVIFRQLTFKPGDLYRRSLVQDSQRRLYGMELFQFVNVEALDQEQQRPSVNMRVTVAEGKHQRTNLGVGYGTEEKARVDGEYHHVNFLGGARTAGARARWSSLDRGVHLDFNQPYFFAPHLSLGGDAQRWYTFTPAYQSVVTGARLTLLHRESQRFSWSVSLASERSNSSIKPEVLNDPLLYADLIALGLDPTTGRQEGTLGSVAFDVQRNTTDNLLDARRGFQVSVHAEEAGRLLPGTFNYYSMSADARHYVPISSRVVIANRVQVGAINAAGTDPKQVPFSRKYFLGGATSIRGWGRYEVSPLSKSGLPIGGNSLFALSSETRIRLKGKLGAVAFLDGGNVWAGDGEFKLRDLRYDVGSGLRYQTPVGPIRIDVGYQLNPNPDLLVQGKLNGRRWRIHFSIGQAF
jgi:outer membrane protein insertion porin family/translocation and assembly module TamA